MIFGILQQKGGVGKTTLSTNLAAEFARLGQNVLIADADPQGSATSCQAAREGDPLFVVVGKPTATIHKEIEMMRKGYDHVIIDGPARVTEITRSAIMASDVIIIPVQPSPYDVWATEDVVKLVREAKIFKESLKCCFVINRKIANTAIGRDVREALAGFDIRVMESCITQRVIFAEAAARGMAAYELDPNSQGAAEVSALMTEILEFAYE